MPDPYYGMPNTDPGGQFNQQIPIPSQQMMDYSYLQNNQALMMQGQSSLQATAQTVQYNFHRDMQNVLQGTMAAGMAIYNTGKSVVDKAKESQYNDMLLGQGNYVLQRSFMREAEWASGFAGSDFGRALKIGGRKPEFMSQEELQWQMDRSWHHRTDELKYEAGGGVVAAGSSLLGMGLTKGMGMMKGLGVGMLIDQTLGRAYDVAYAQPAEYRREFRNMTEVTDLNAGVGQRRLTGATSNALADRFYERDQQSWARYIPFIGDALADRLAPDTKAKEFMPKMMQAGLFRDQNLQDVDKMEKFVKDTIGIVEKFAALANTTKDSILGLKAKLNNMGLSEGQQTSALGNIITTSMSTGLSAEMVSSYHGAFSATGFQNGYNKGVVGDRGLIDLASMKALQDAGIIDRSFDPGSLSINNLQNAINRGATGAGIVNRYGGGGFNPFMAGKNLGNLYGGGDQTAGTVLRQKNFVTDDGDPLANFKQSVRDAYKEFLKTNSPTRALAAVVSTFSDGSQEQNEQVKNALWSDEQGKMLAAGSVGRKEFERTGDTTKLTSFKLKDIKNAVNLFDTHDMTVGLGKYSNDIKEGAAFSSDDKRKYLDFNSLFKEKIQAMHRALLDGDITKANKIKAQIIDDGTRGSGTGNSLSANDAEKAIKIGLADVEEDAKKNEYYTKNMQGAFGNAYDYFTGNHHNVDDNGKRWTVAQAMSDASTGSFDPRKLKDFTGYSDISGKVKNIFSKMMTNNASREQMKFLYNQVGDNKDDNIKLFNVVFDKLDNFGLKSDEINTIKQYLHDNGDAGGKGLFSDYVKTNSGQTNYAIRNSFEILKSRNDPMFNKWTESDYASRGTWLNDNLNKLRSMKSAKEAQTWLNTDNGHGGKNRDDIYNNAYGITGNKGFATQLLSGIEDHVKLSLKDKNSNQFFKWMDSIKDMSVDASNVDDVAKKFGMSIDNPNTQAVIALTKACEALAGAIGK